MKRLFILILAIACIVGLVGCDKLDIDSAQDAQCSFEAHILEIHDTHFLVEPVKGSSESRSADKIEVTNKNIDSPLVPGVGSLLKITYDGMIQETYPARITNVYKIEILGETIIEIPELKDICGYTEEQLTNLLSGFSDADLVAVWGKPASTLSGACGDVWNVDESMLIIVYYTDAWVVESAKPFPINNEPTKSDPVKVESTTYKYEKDGFGGDFTITLNDDGTFQYYEGMLSSYIGIGTWIMDDDNVICLTDNAMGDRTMDNYFKMEGNDLVWIEEGSDNFMYIKVVDGERFFATQTKE